MIHLSCTEGRVLLNVPAGSAVAQKLQEVQVSPDQGYLEVGQQLPQVSGWHHSGGVE